MIYIGLDPGKGGGIAFITDDGLIIKAFKMPETDNDLLGALRRQPDVLVSAMLEKVWSQPGMGHTGSFSFGRGYGALRMALTATITPFDEVAPATWQKAMGCRTKGDKNVSKRKAQDLFPDTNFAITHAIADAILIAEYARRVAQRK